MGINLVSPETNTPPTAFLSIRCFIPKFFPLYIYKGKKMGIKCFEQVYRNKTVTINFLTAPD